MPTTPVRSPSVRALGEDAHAVPASRRRPRPRHRSRARARRHGGVVPLHVAAELSFGAALVVVPALVGLPLGVAVLGAIMGVLIASTAISAPATELPIRGSGKHDRVGIDALLVGLAAMLLVVGERGAGLLVLAAVAHAALTLLPGRVGAGR